MQMIRVVLWFGTGQILLGYSTGEFQAFQLIVLAVFGTVD